MSMFTQRTLPHVFSAEGSTCQSESHVCEVSHTHSSHLRRWEMFIITQLSFSTSTECTFTLVCLRFRQYDLFVNMKLLTFVSYPIHVNDFLEMKNSSPLVRNFSQLWSLSWSRYKCVSLFSYSVTFPWKQFSFVMIYYFIVQTTHLSSLQ